ncbi:(2E,6E)-farnesyl diphosphate synthase [Arenicella chitinivorans]|uniref:(2E,6E)-farnesyl diphosphate synthase n=1 Tax=Arenicella chitinivorans TaxID=1329800 RepID=A0A918VJR3_9GAMM|nr:farnesyl diphosphate synthase [Arenicella chitinivorans]GHA01732.1 (2E,6E)-farnesyl diphosphate synthase [Arenicella chitinivorans]
MSKLTDLQARIEAVLAEHLSRPGIPDRLRAAMKYSTLSGGKRIRAILVYAAGTAASAKIERLDAVAAAIECVHAYSLIHDDLPAMDDDDLRRGQPTSHIQFDEATAILAGDALQTLAFEILAESELSDQQARQITLLLARSAGAAGMVGGQMIDILATEQELNQLELENMHRCKTGALINAAVIGGALCADSLDERVRTALEKYAANLGLAFQVIDDILDIESTTEQLGKPNGSDTAAGKVTFPQLLGLTESKQFAQKLYHDAMESLQLIGDNTESPIGVRLLSDIAERVVTRTH